MLTDSPAIVNNPILSILTSSQTIVDKLNEVPRSQIPKRLLLKPFMPMLIDYRQIFYESFSNC